MHSACYGFVIAATSAQAFHFIVDTRRSTTSSTLFVRSSYGFSSTGLFAKYSVKQAGGGIPIHVGESFWDPAVEGKLGGTGTLEARLSQGYQYQLLPLSDHESTATTPSSLLDTQHWLEEIGNPPPTFAKATQPVSGIVLGRGKLIEDDAPGDIQHIVIQLPRGFHYVEGQSLSVIPPGIDKTLARDTNLACTVLPQHGMVTYSMVKRSVCVSVARNTTTRVHK